MLYIETKIRLYSNDISIKKICCLKTTTHKKSQKLSTTLSYKSLNIGVSFLIKKSDIEKRLKIPNVDRVISGLENYGEIVILLFYMFVSFPCILLLRDGKKIFAPAYPQCQVVWMTVGYGLIVSPQNSYIEILTFKVMY